MDLSQSPVTLILILLNVIFSLVGFSNGNFVNKMIGWPYYEKKEKQYYRFVTSGFLHADWFHLIFNMLTLYYFGTNIELIFAAGKLGGIPAYLCLYFFGMIVADIPGYFKHNDDINYRSLGASGAVAAVLFASIIFSPWNQIQLYGIIRLSAVLFAVLYIVYCVYMGKRNLDNIGHDAHLWGSVFGLVFTLILIGVMRPDLFPYISEDLKHPNLFGNHELSSVLKYILVDPIP